MNENNEHYKSMCNNLLGIGVDIFKDYGEMALDFFTDDNIIKNIPIISTFINLGKCGITIRTLQFARNYCSFIEKVRNGEIPKEQLEKHINELNTNPKQMQKEIETLLIYLEQYKEINQIEYMANIYRAFLLPDIGGIDWDEVVIFFELLSRLLPRDIEDLNKIALHGARASEFNDHSGLLRLSSLGLVQYFNGKEEKYGHNKSGVAKLTGQGKLFYRVITYAKAV